MLTIDSILAMIESEGRMGGVMPKNHYFDEFLNRDYIARESQESEPSKMGYILFNIETNSDSENPE